MTEQAFAARWGRSASNSSKKRTTGQAHRSCGAKAFEKLNESQISTGSRERLKPSLRYTQNLSTSSTLKS